MTDKELRDIALQAAARSAAVDDLNVSVKELADTVQDLASTVAETVPREEMESAVRKVTRRYWRTVAAILLALAYLVPNQIIHTKDGQINRVNGRILIGCTSPPPENATAEQREAHRCYTDGVARTASAVSSINCVTLLAHGVRLPDCEDERVALEKAGVVLGTLPPG